MKSAKTAGMLGLVMVAAIASPCAVAADPGGYVGINFGRAQGHFDDGRIAGQLQGAGLTTTAIADDDRDGGFKLYGGYQFNRYFSLEGGYFDLGKFGFTAATVPAGTLTGEFRVTGWNLDAVGSLPITERFSAFARAGLTYGKTRDSFGGTGAVLVLNPSPSDRDAGYKYGVGLEYDFTQSFGVRAEAERYRVSDAIGGKANIDLFSVGLVYRFGAKAPVQRVEPARPAPPYVAPPPPRPAVVAPQPAPEVVTPPPPPPAEKPMRKDRN